MATQNEINSWYDKFARDKIRNMGINLYNPKDVERLRVPTQDRKETKPLFEKGFKNTAEEKAKLYKYAKDGRLFVFHKENNKPYQMTEKSVKSCEKEESQEKRVSFGKKVGYRVAKTAWKLPRFGIGLVGRLLNLFTLGLFRKQIKSIQRGIDIMSGAWAEKFFSVKAQRKERENKIGLGERLGNLLTLGSYKKEKITEIRQQKEYEKNRSAMREVLNKEKEEWQRMAETDRKKTEKKSNGEEELEKTKKKLNKINELEKEIFLNDLESERDMENKTELENRENETDPENMKEQEEIQGVDIEQEVQEIKDSGNELEERKPENQEEIEKDHGNQGGDNQTPEDRGKEMKSKLRIQYEDMKLAFGPGGGGLVKAVELAQNMNRLVERLKNDQEAVKAIGMKEEDLKKLSNMCNNMETVVKEGLEASIQLMVPEDGKDLNKEQRERCICQIQLMNFVERAMVNSAYASYLDQMDTDKKPKLDGNNVKNSKLFNEMCRDPEKFKRNLYSSIQKLDSTKKLKEMTPEQLAEFIKDPGNLRKAQTNDIREGAKITESQRQKQSEFQKTQQQEERQQEEQQIMMQNL